jgi:large subunit ribosomal protein L25
MEKALLLKAEIREKTGSKSAARLREESRIPAIVYGHKKEPVAITLDAHEVTEGLHHGHRLVEVQFGKKKETMMFKDVQYDHLGKKIIHADLVRVNVTERVKVAVPIELKGTAKGTHEGGIVEAHTDSLEIECQVTNIPESIVVSVKELSIGDRIYASSIELGEGIKLISDPSMLIASCHVVAEIKTTEELEQEIPAAPEVIGKGKEEEEGEETVEEKKTE